MREDSHTRRALAIALDGAREVGAQAQMLDLRRYELVFCSGEDDDSRYPADVLRMRGEVRAAQGIILATPEYHGSFSGVLKNALDLMGFEEFEGKVVGLVGVSGGKMGAVGALDSLRAVGRSLRAWVVPEQANIPEASKLFDGESGLPERLRQRLMNVGRQVGRFAFLHSSEKAREFLREWEQAQTNPGG